MALNTHRYWLEGVRMIVRRLRRAGCDISYARVHAILKSYYLVTTSLAKSRQHNLVRYKRLYSDAMWHTDCTP